MRNNPALSGPSVQKRRPLKPIAQQNSICGYKVDALLTILWVGSIVPGRRIDDKTGVSLRPERAILPICSSKRQLIHNPSDAVLMPADFATFIRGNRFEKTCKSRQTIDASSAQDI
jgi:hypothetical protein